MAKFSVFLVCVSCFLQANLIWSAKPQPNQMISQLAYNSSQENSANGCTCGVFLTGQFVKGSSKPPVGYPPISKDIDDLVSCGSGGVKQCTNRCVESLVFFLPKSADLICASIDRDCYKERAFLFVNNCNQGWFNTKFSAGREYCCKNNEYFKCPV